MVWVNNPVNATKNTKIINNQSLYVLVPLSLLVCNLFTVTTIHPTTIAMPLRLPKILIGWNNGIGVNSKITSAPTASPAVAIAPKNP